MKRWMIPLLIAACASLSFAADRKDAEQVNIDQMTRETQKTAASEVMQPIDRKGFNFVWYVPIEFWRAAVLQNSNVVKADGEAMLKNMNGVFVLCVTRAQIEAAGKFNFFDEATVAKNLVVEYTDAAGKTRPLAPQADVNPATASVLAAMKPMLKAAMGQTGQNMYFFVFADTEKGQRFMSPFEPGKLTVSLKTLAGDAGGKAEFQFPLNALYMPRVCTNCHHGGLEILWHFCPYCGVEIKE